MTRTSISNYLSYKAKLEYKIVTAPSSVVDDTTMEAWLNLLGGDGWVLTLMDKHKVYFSRCVSTVGVVEYKDL